MIRVTVAGATGWVGRPLVEAIAASEDLQLVAAVSRSAAGQTVAGVTVSASVTEALALPADVFVDYTSASAVKEHVLAAIAAGLHVVIGSSGLSVADYEDIDEAAREKGVGVIAVGNFSIVAALLQRFSVEAAKHLPAWEIIDIADWRKPDAPSGTARELAWRISQAARPQYQVPVDETVGQPEARGADAGGTRIHSVRLPGYVIGVEARFGRGDERLTISYEGGPSATPYIDGTLLAIRRVAGIRGLMRGMDEIL